MSPSKKNTDHKKKIAKSVNAKIRAYFSDPEMAPMSFEELQKALWAKPRSSQRFFIRTTLPKLRDFIAIYAVSGVTPCDMGITTDEVPELQGLEFSFPKNPFWRNPEEKPIEFFSFSEWKKQHDDGENYAEAYFSSINDKVQKATERILIYDYFMNSPESFSPQKQNTYFDGYNTYFKLLEEKKDIEYIRILAPSLDKYKSLERIGGNKHDHNNTVVREVIEHLFVDTFEHIVRAFDLFGDRFKLKIMPVPCRAFSVMLIDNKFILSEYYRIRKNGFAVPDILFVESMYPDSIYEKMYRTYESEFLQICNSEDGAIEVTKELFLSLTTKLLEKKGLALSSAEDVHRIHLQNEVNLLNKKLSFF